MGDFILLVFSEQATPRLTRRTRHPDRKYCFRTPITAGHHQCVKADKNAHTRRAVPYKDCEIVRSSSDSSNNVHNEIKSSANCRPNKLLETTRIGDTRCYAFNPQGSCRDASYNGHRQILTANSRGRA